MDTIQHVCKNCGSEQIAEFCCRCGQKTITKRFTTRSFLIKFLSAFNFERGFFFTIKMLFLNPGEVINNYLGGKTKSYYNPLNYLILLAGIGTALIIWMGIFDANVETTNKVFGVNQAEHALHFQKKVITFMKQYVNVISLLMLPFMSLFSKWYFYKKKYFYGEHLIMNSFLFGQSSALAILTLPVYLIAPQLINFYSIIGGTLFFIYYSYAIKGVFKCNTLKSILGSLVIFIGGYLSFLIVFTILMMVVMIIIVVVNDINLKELMMQ